MLLAIKMPTWLVDFWTVYGDMITPVLVTVVLALLTSLALKIKSDAKTNAAKAELQIEALKEVANREDNKPELERQSAEIEDLKRVVTYQSEMINLAFQNSNLTPEVKDNLTSLSNKIKYGTEADLVKELEDRNAKLIEEITALKSELETKVVPAVSEKISKRTRR
jgi:small-conductance mechanosensitive channel